MGENTRVLAYDDFCLFFDSYREHSLRVLKGINPDQVHSFVTMISKARHEGRMVYLIGNGGSASIASHFAIDLMNVNRFLEGEKPIRAISLAENTAVLTGLSNDINYEQVFVIQLAKLLQPGDLLVAISASGRSPNILRAVDYCNRHGGFSVGLVGFEGGELKNLCHHTVHIETPLKDYGPVEDSFLFLDHLITAYLSHTMAVSE